MKTLEGRHIPALRKGNKTPTSVPRWVCAGKDSAPSAPPPWLPSVGAACPQLETVAPRPRGLGLDGAGQSHRCPLVLPAAPSTLLAPPGHGSHLKTPWLPPPRPPAAIPPGTKPVLGPAPGSFVGTAASRAAAATPSSRSTRCVPSRPGDISSCSPTAARAPPTAVRTPQGTQGKKEHPRALVLGGGCFRVTLNPQLHPRHCSHLSLAVDSPDPQFSGDSPGHSKNWRCPRKSSRSHLGKGQTGTGGAAYPPLVHIPLATLLPALMCR